MTAYKAHVYYLASPHNERPPVSCSNMRAAFSVLLVVIALLELLEASDVGTDADAYVEKVFGEVPAKRLKALYREAQKFILTITGDGLVTTVTRELGIDLNTPSNATIERIRSVKIETSTLLPKAAKAGAGYIIVVVIGIVLTLFFFISCCCFFCCRKTGCCCGRVSEETPSGSESLALALLIALLFVVSLLLILSAYGAAASGLATSKGMKKDEETGLPFLGHIIKPMKGLIKFIPETIKEISETLDVDEFGEQFTKLLPNFPEIIQGEIKALDQSCSSCAKLMTSYKDVTTQSDGISKSLEKINSHERSLKEQKYEKLKESLGHFKTSTLDAISTCSTENCVLLGNKATSLEETRTVAAFQFPTLKGYVEPLKEMSLYSIDAFQFQNFSEETKEITKVAQSFIKNVKDVIDDLPLNSMDRFDANFSDEVKTLAPSLPWDLLDSVNQHLPRAIKALAVLTVLVVVVIVILNITGVSLGFVCQRKNRKASQRTFLINSQLTFCIATLLCITTIPLFIMGTLLYREVCWDIKKGSRSTYFQLADTLVREQVTSLSNFSFDGISVTIRTEEMKFITKTLYEDCKNNGSFTKVLIDNLLLDDNTVDAILKKAMPQIENYVRNYDMLELPIFSIDNSNKLKEVGRKFDGLQVVEFDPTKVSLILPFSLSQVGEDMKKAIADVSEPGKSNLQSLIEKDLPELEEISKDIGIEENDLANEFKSVSEKLEIVKNQIPVMIKEIPLAKNQIKNVNMADKLLKVIEAEAKKSFWNFYDYLKKRLSETAHCRVLYENFDALVFGLCDLLVDPLNGFWICLGVCVVLLIPSFLAGLHVGGLFARKYKSNKVI